MKIIFLMFWNMSVFKILTKDKAQELPFPPPVGV